jgi:hypothetical protein
MTYSQWRLVSLGIGSAAYMENNWEKVLQHITIKKTIKQIYNIRKPLPAVSL